MEKSYITEIEQEKCRKVAKAYAELYEIENIVVLDVGRFGFVKLQYYRPPHSFDDVVTFTDSRSMFENLWEEWFDTKLYLLAKGTPMLKGYVKFSNVCRKKSRESLQGRKRYLLN